MTSEVIAISSCSKNSCRGSARVETSALDGRVTTLIVLVKGRDFAVDGRVGREDLLQSRDKLVLSPFGKFFGAGNDI